MEFTAQQVPADRQLVQGYGPGEFKIAGIRWQGSVLVCRDATQPWPVRSPAELDLASLEPLRGAAADILVVGTGASFLLLPPELRRQIRDWGMVVEAMATPAACRTYNVLLAEERRVAAALIVLPPAA